MNLDLKDVVLREIDEQLRNNDYVYENGGDFYLLSYIVGSKFCFEIDNKKYNYVVTFVDNTCGRVILKSEQIYDHPFAFDTVRTFAHLIRANHVLTGHDNIFVAGQVNVAVPLLNKRKRCLELIELITENKK